MKIPTHEQAMAWYKELETPNNIIAHVKTVNRVAVFLTKELMKKGVKINLELVDSASLLHDLDKWLCINDKSIDHGFETEKILIEKGYPEVGFYARQHRADLITENFETWEEKIISYADKRCNGDKIVTLKERFDYVNEKYPAKDIKKRKLEMKMFFELEKEIFKIIGMKPEDLK